MIGGRSFVSLLHSTSPYMLRCARGETKLCNKESDGTRGVVDMFFPTVSFQMRYTCCAHWHACDVRVNNDQVALCNEGKAALCNERHKERWHKRGGGRPDRSTSAAQYSRPA